MICYSTTKMLQLCNDYTVFAETKVNGHFLCVNS